MKTLYVIFLPLFFAGLAKGQASNTDNTDSSRTLKEINIKASKPVIRQEADRIIYDLQADPESRSKSVLEMLRKVPFISLDASNNILLKGNSSYRIFINGRPSALVANNPKEVLGMMPASAIKSIEVITTPPARYEAEGIAGIINIQLIKNTADGVNGVVNLSGKYPQGGTGLGGSMAMRRGALGLALFGGLNTNTLPGTDAESYRETATSRMLQNKRNSGRNQGGYIGTEISYDIDTLNLLSASVNIYDRHADNNSRINTTITAEDKLITGYAAANASRNKSTGLDAGINYQKGFKSNKRNLLTFSYNFRNNGNNLDNELLFDNRVNYSEPGYNQTNQSKATENTVQADYTQSFRRFVMEGGVKGIFRVNNSQFNNYSFNEVSKQYELNAGNDFSNHQTVYGVYNSYSFSAKKWDIRAGLRLEATITKSDTIQTNFLHLIPTIAVGYKLNDRNSVNLGVNRRIKRPGINKLNPYVNRLTPNNETVGNPALEPSLANSISVGYGKSGRLNVHVILEYGFFNKLEMGVSHFDSTRNVTVSTFENTGKGDVYTSNINIGYQVTRYWDLSFNGNLTKVKLTSSGINSLLYNLYLSNSFKIEKGWLLNCDLRINGRNIVSAQATSNGFYACSFSVSKLLMKGNLAIAAGIDNPFATYRKNEIKTRGEGFYEQSISHELYRNIRISADLKLGKLKSAVKKVKRGINNNDISNSKGGF